MPFTTSSLLAVLLAATNCLAQDKASFPRPPKSARAVKNQFIVQYKDSKAYDVAKQNKALSTHDGSSKVVKYIDSRNVEVVNFSSEESAKKWLEKNAEMIKYFEEDSLFYVNRLASSHGSRRLAETTPYGIGHVNAELVSDDHVGNRKVCVIDSGYDMGHEDLPVDVIDNTGSLITGTSFVPGFDWFTDENSHGTHVTGTIVALGDNGKGVKGVIRNGNLKLHIAKVFAATGGAYCSTILDAIEDCVANDANVINMSLGGSSPCSSMDEAIADAYNDDDIITFAASGNSYGSGYEYPASLPYVVSVASITEAYQRSSFSTYNDEVDLCAPGSLVNSTVPGNAYDSYSGTSMACPHAAGVAALVWSHYPDLPAATLVNILETTATDLPFDANNGYDNEYGHGLINAEAAYQALLASIPPTVSPAPSLSSAPSSTPSESSAPSSTPSSAPSSTPSVSSAPSSTPSEFCPTGVEAKVEVQTDGYPEDTSWDIKDATDFVIASRTLFDSANTLYKDRVCLAETAGCLGTDYTFTINDSFGDGLCCAYGPGFYRVLIENEVFFEGGDYFFSSESTSLCRTSAPSLTPTVSPAPSLTPTVSPGPSLSSAPSSTPSSMPSEDPSSMPSEDPSSMPSEDPSSMPSKSKSKKSKNKSKKSKSSSSKSWRK